MAPAGSYASLSAAIRAGADSVYFGVDKLNMRSRAASPFHLGDLKRIARICRWCGVKSYLALNVIVYDDELGIMQEVCDAAKAARIDAVIASDISCIEYARSIGLEVHISVQANISSIGSVKFYARYADVMVLARELTLEQISTIGNAIKEQDIRGPKGELVQIELFAHGALCVAISGKCYMSLGCYNQSANRGACFQNCRRAYRLVDVETGDELEVQNQYIMSPRDLCTLPHLDKLAEAGVSVFKLEGRARTAQYVGTVTKAYRAGLDAVEAGTFDPENFQPLEAGLASVFNRGFWDGGYYCGEKMGEWAASGHSQATHKRIELGTVSPRSAWSNSPSGSRSFCPAVKFWLKAPPPARFKLTSNPCASMASPPTVPSKMTKSPSPSPKKPAARTRCSCFSQWISLKTYLTYSLFANSVCTWSRSH
jgi:putative protease